MPFRKIRPWGSTKPPVGTSIDESHSLSELLDGAWPLNENGGALVRDASERNQVPGIFSGTSDTWSSAIGGLGITCGSGTGFVNLGSAGNYTSENFSIALGLVQTSSSGNQVVFYKGAFNVKGYYCQISAGTFAPSLRTNQSGASQITTAASAAMSLNVPAVVVFTRSGATVRIYVNGIETVYGLVGSHIDPVTSTDNLQLGNYAAGANPFLGRIFWYAQWRGRVLTQSDAQLLSRRPFSFYKPTSRRIISRAVAGVDATVNAAGVAATGATGTVSVAGDANVSPTGISGTGAVGTATAAGAANVTATGASATGALGAVSVSGDANVAVSGVSSSGAVGDVSVSGTGDVTVAVTGVSATGAVGQVVVTAEDNAAPLDGVMAFRPPIRVRVPKRKEIVPAVEPEPLPVSVAVQVKGVSAVGAVGIVSVAAGASVAVAGVSAQGEVGIVSVTGDATVIATPVSAQMIQFPVRELRAPRFISDEELEEFTLMAVGF